MFRYSCSNFQRSSLFILLETGSIGDWCFQNFTAAGYGPYFSMNFSRQSKNASLSSLIAASRAVLYSEMYPEPDFGLPSCFRKASRNEYISLSAAVLGSTTPMMNLWR